MMKSKLLLIALTALFCTISSAYCGISIPGKKSAQPVRKQPRYQMKYGAQKALQMDMDTETEQIQPQASEQNFEAVSLIRSSLEQPKNFSCVTDSDDVKFCTDADKKPLEGKIAKKNSDGGYESIENYKKGYLTGLCSYFYPNGNPKMCLYYKDGQKNGMFKLYHPGRGIEISANYKNNKLDGMLDVYLADGTLYGRMRYKNGKLEKGYCNKNGKKESFNSAMLRSYPDNQINSCGIPIWQPD